MFAFWNKVDRRGENECWPWLAYKQADGYGTFRVPGDEKVKAHRMAWILMRGEIPEGLYVCHHCDNPSCVNPAHLFLGTHWDNVQDKVAKGRQYNAGRPPSLSDDDVRYIRSSKEPGVRLADKFGLSPASICNIRKRKMYERVA